MEKAERFPGARAPVCLGHSGRGGGGRGTGERSRPVLRMSNGRERASCSRARGGGGWGGAGGGALINRAVSVGVLSDVCVRKRASFLKNNPDSVKKKRLGFYAPPGGLAGGPFDFMVSARVFSGVEFNDPSRRLRRRVPGEEGNRAGPVERSWCSSGAALANPAARHSRCCPRAGTGGRGVLFGVSDTAGRVRLATDRRNRCVSHLGTQKSSRIIPWNPKRSAASGSQEANRFPPPPP